MVMADMAQPRESFVLLRGAYDHKGDKVVRAVPAALSPFPADAATQSAWGWPRG